MPYFLNDECYFNMIGNLLRDEEGRITKASFQYSFNDVEELKTFLRSKYYNSKYDSKVHPDRLQNEIDKQQRLRPTINIFDQNFEFNPMDSVLTPNETLERDIAIDNIIFQVEENYNKKSFELVNTEKLTLNFDDCSMVIFKTDDLSIIKNYHKISRHCNDIF